MQDPNWVYGAKEFKSKPVQYQQIQCVNTNCLVDFQMDVGAVKRPNVKIVNAPASQGFSLSDRRYIEQQILARWERVAPELLEKIPTGYCDLWIALFLVLAFLLIVGLCCLIPYQKTRLKNADKAAQEWRNLFIKEMQDFIHNDLKQKYPNLTFTLIYPICIYKTLVTFQNNTPISQTPLVGHVWCYIRISNGPLPIGDSNEPTFDNTTTQSNNNNNNKGGVVLSVKETQLTPLMSSHNTYS